MIAPSNAASVESIRAPLWRVSTAGLDDVDLLSHLGPRGNLYGQARHVISAQTKAEAEA